MSRVLAAIFVHPIGMASCAVSFWLICAWLIALHPFSEALGLVALGVSVLAIWRPMWALSLMLAGLPVANLSIWSGWTVTQEFDLLFMLCMAGSMLGMLRTRSQHGLPKHAPDLGQGSTQMYMLMLCGVVMVTSFVSARRGWQDAGTHLSMHELLWGGYEGIGNVWRVSKSSVALCLAAWWLWLLKAQHPHALMRHMHSGMCLGLAAVCIAAILERMTYVGLWELDGHYRTTAAFWEMHLGGGAIDMYLAMSVPFAVWGMLHSSRPLRWVLHAALMVAAMYVVITTYSRGITAVACVGVLAMYARYAWMRNSLPSALPDWSMRANALMLLILIAEVSLLLANSHFMMSRLQDASVDVGGRFKHWAQLIQVPQTNAEHWLGVGQGRLVARQVAASDAAPLPGRVVFEPRLKESSVLIQGAHDDLRLQSRLALVQKVPASQHDFRIKFKASALQPTQVKLSVCVRHLIYSRHCQVTQGWVTTPSPTWYDWALVGPVLSASSRAPWQPDFMAMIAVQDLDAGIHFYAWEVDSSASDYERHYWDFSEGMSRWYFVSSGYFRPWHADNLYVELYVERGLLGLITYAALLFGSLFIAFRNLSKYENIWPFAMALFSFMVLGCVVSVMETTRLAFLSGILVLMPLLWGGLLRDSRA